MGMSVGLATIYVLTFPDHLYLHRDAKTPPILLILLLLIKPPARFQEVFSYVAKRIHFFLSQHAIIKEAEAQKHGTPKATMLKESPYPLPSQPLLKLPIPCPDLSSMKQL